MKQACKMEANQKPQNPNSLEIKHCPMCGSDMKGDKRMGWVCLDCFLIFEKENVE